MGMVQDRLYCLNCGKETLHARSQFSGAIGCILTIFTGLLFLPVWFLIAVVQSTRPMRCQICGLEYHASAVRDHARRGRLARAAAVPPMPPRPAFDWAGLGRKIAGGVHSVSTGLAGSCEAAARNTAAFYRGLPEWATPIVWGLGITAPAAGVAILGRYLEWW
jgi:hypothetical protein